METIKKQMGKDSTKWKFFKIYLLEEESIHNLYHQEWKKQLELIPNANEINKELKNIQNAIEQMENEALGRRIKIDAESG